jgi:hypothetical protein
MSNIQLTKDTAVSNALAQVKMKFSNHTKAVLLGAEDELQALLQVLPDTPVCVHSVYMDNADDGYGRQLNCWWEGRLQHGLI